MCSDQLGSLRPRLPQKWERNHGCDCGAFGVIRALRGDSQHAGPGATSLEFLLGLIDVPRLRDLEARSKNPNFDLAVIPACGGVGGSVAQTVGHAELQGDLFVEASDIFQTCGNDLSSSDFCNSCHSLKRSLNVILGNCGT